MQDFDFAAQCRFPIFLPKNRGAKYMRLIFAMTASCLIASPAMASGDATQGQRDFSRCAACHSIAPRVTTVSVLP